MSDLLTIGALARLLGVRTSTLRFYEEQGLLSPDARTAAGYRQYRPAAVDRVRLIQRAQRLGFALADIQQLLSARDSGDLDDEAIISIAEDRYFRLEKQVTERLVLQHELELFLQDLDRREKDPQADSAFDKLLERVCADPDIKTSPNFVLDWLMARAHCNLTTPAGQEILVRLQGQHVHVWQEQGDYHILFVTQDPKVIQSLEALAELEADCQTHTDDTYQFAYGDEGPVFVARGENAFIFARLFLALERDGPNA
jgi:DNA-binding transcriptional MerR regulator